VEAKVPQRIDMEDRLVGPLTLQQFLYLLFGGLIIYLVNNWTSGSVLRPLILYPVVLIIAPISLALAFVKVQERPFIYFLASFYKYLTRPKRRVWQRGQAQNLVKFVSKEKEEATTTAVKTYSKENVQQAIRKVEGINGQEQR